jgi:large subunit ribosomal protein L24
MANAAKYARRLKHIRKVKAAIRFQEQARERLMAIKKKKHESKQYLLQADDNFVHEPRRKLKDTLKRAEQDWKLGPLRQNFAVGVDAKLWGVAARKDMQKPTLPEHWFGSADREEKAIAKGVQKLIPEHVRRDYSPIAVDDRVVVLRGRDAGKIGVVRSVYKNTNSLLVENLNKVSSNVMHYSMSN